MSRSTRFTQGKIWFDDFCPCKRFEILPHSTAPIGGVSPVQNVVKCKKKQFENAKKTIWRAVY